MLPPVPQLADYGLSPTRGFLPAEPPIQCLPHQLYDKWERIMNNFQPLLLSKRLRTVIDRLPVIPAVHLETEAEWRLPPPITYPFLQVCEHLELPPVATYSGLVLWNFKPIFLSDDLKLDNLATLATFTGSIDEQWFYLVSAAIEARGGPAIRLMLDAIEAARVNNAKIVTQKLLSTAQIIDELGTILVRMYENCDPHVFYHRIRPFLAGSKNMKDAGLPNGMMYDDGRHQSWQKYNGGSAAQSSLIQFFDVALGVEHRPTGVKMNESSESEPESGVSPKVRHSFIHEMRQYMPGAHRRFLQAVEGVANIRDFVEDNRNERQLTIAYDACLAMLRSLRDKHITIVSRYIIVKGREARSRSRSRASDARDQATPRTGIASIRHGRDEQRHGKTLTKQPRGTGGTALIPFLKQARDETGEPAIDDWARRILTGARRTEADAEIAFQNRINAAELDAGEPEIVGLAGSWNMEDNGGGICGV